MLKILFVEDIPEDVEIAERELGKAGLTFESMRVDSKVDFLAALAEFDPSVIISDYSMPRFDGMKALKLSLEWKAAIPFIVLTGSKNEETAVLCLKSGASDYVIKGHISRLPFAVIEALEHARVSRENEVSLRALRESEQDYRTMADSGQALVWTSDVDKLCKYFNKTWLDFTGRNYEEEYGNGWTAGVHPNDLRDCVDVYVAAFERREKFSMAYRLRRKDGEYRWIQDDGCPRYGAGGEFIGYIGHCLDITELKRAETRIKQALQEKETLLRELFHRTRNNMQVIMAILALEEETVHDELVSKIVRETSERIMTMSLVHTKLFESQDLSSIDLKDYAQDLLAILMSAESFASKRIRVTTRMEPISVLIDTAIPFGLVLHELASNAFVHAFPGDSSGEVLVRISRSPEGRVELEVTDDGRGLPADFDFRRKDTLGFQLMHSLVEQQLKGTLRFETKRGLSCHVDFMDTKTMKRI